MNFVRFACVVILAGLSGGATYAQSSHTASASPSANANANAEHNGIPLERLLAAVSKTTGKKFLIDPQVHVNITLVGQDLSNISYNDLLTILLIEGITAVEYGGYVNVRPDAWGRALPSPLLSGGESAPDAEFVTKVITVKTVNAAHLVPILRPMIPQYGHLVAFPCTNKLLLVDTFANVRRLEAVIESLDVGGEPYKFESCYDRASSDHHS